MKNNRDVLIDIAKGISMVAVMMYHCGGFRMGNLLNAFMLPSFVIYSGIMLGQKRDIPSIVEYVKKKAMRFVPQYYLCGMVNLLFYSLYVNYFGSVNFWKFVTPALLGEVNTEGYYFTGTLWFVAMLFSTSLCFFLIIKLLPRKWERLICYVLIWGVGVALAKKDGWQLPFRMDLLPYTIPFMGVGYEVANSGMYNNYKSASFSLERMLLGVVGLYTFTYMSNGTAEWYFHRMSGDMFSIVAAGLCGTLCCFELSKIIIDLELPTICGNDIFQFVGSMSFIYMMIHQHYVIYSLNWYSIWNNDRVVEQGLRLSVCILICTFVAVIVRIVSESRWKNV